MFVHFRLYPYQLPHYVAWCYCPCMYLSFECQSSERSTLSYFHQSTHYFLMRIEILLRFAYPYSDLLDGIILCFILISHFINRLYAQYIIILIMLLYLCVAGCASYKCIVCFIIIAILSHYFIKCFDGFRCYMFIPIELMQEERGISIIPTKHSFTLRGRSGSTYHLI